MNDPNMFNDPNYLAQAQGMQMQNEPYETEGTMQLSQFGTQDPRIIEKILDLSNTLLNQLEHDLRGEVIDLETAEWKQVKKPVMNKEGVDKLMSLLKIPLNPINSLSVYDDELINKKCRLFHLHISYLIKAHFMEWGIDIKDRSFIIHNIAGLYQSILLMSKNGKYLNSLSNTLQTKEIFRTGQEQHSPGVFSGFRRRFFNFKI